MHWTDKDVDTFKFHLCYDFIAQFDYARSKRKLSQKKTAELVGMPLSRLRKLLNDPSTLTFEQMIQMCKAVDLKLGLIVYNNTPSPIHGIVFNRCWEKQGQPADMFELGGWTNLMDESGHKE